jgi:hypothetical protein
MVEELKCPICCSVLVKEKCNKLYNSDKTAYRYTCALMFGEHYLGYLNDDQSFIEEETISLIWHNKHYAITQYNYPPNYDVLVIIFDDNHQYEFSVEISFTNPPFDFLHTDLDQNVKRLKTILTFR